MKTHPLKHLLASSLLWLAVLPVPAATVSWVSTNSGSWGASTNWSSGSVPGATDDVLITNSGIYTVTVNVNTTNASLQVGGSSGTQTLAIPSSTLTLNGASLLNTNVVLALNGGTLTGTGNVTVAGALNWSGGDMLGSGRTILASGATLTVSGSNTKGLTRTIDNAGTVNYTGTALYFGWQQASATLFNNLAGGVFNVTGDGDFSQNYAAAHAFNNAGTFNKSGTNTTTVFTGVALTNTGTVNFTAGTLSLNGGGSSSSPIDVPAGTTLNLNGNFNFPGSGTALSGAGTINFNGGTINFSSQLLPTGTVNFNGGTVTIANTMPPATIGALSSGTVVFNAAQSFPSLTLNGGTLSGSGDVTITGTLNWSDGNMSGSGRTIVASGATLTISGTTTKGLTRTMDNAGTVNYAGTGLYFGWQQAIATTFNNLASGVFNVTGEGDFSQNYAAAHAFNNAGTFNKSGASTTTVFTGVALTNTGTVNFTAGTLSLNGGGSSSSPIDVAAAATFNLNGNFNFPGSGTALSGAGTINFNGGTINFSSQLLPTGTVNFNGGTVTIANTMPPATIGALSSGTVVFNAAQSFPSLTLNGGTLSGSGDVTITGTLNWSDGNMSGSGKTIIASGAVLTISGTSTKGLTRTIDNAGTANYPGTGLYFGYGQAIATTFNNLTGGVFSVTGEGDFSQNYAAAHSFNNAGTFNKSGAGTTTLFTGVAFTNTGTVNFTSGTLSLNAGGSSSSPIDVAAGATLNLNGNFNFPGSGTALSGAGTINFNGGTINFSSQLLPTGTVNFNGGTVTIANSMPPATIGALSSGTVVFNAAQSFPSLTLNGGTLSGSGDVTITGTLNWSDGGMSGSGKTIIASGATLTISGTASKGFTRTIDNAGTVNYPGTGLYFGWQQAVATTFNNLASGVFNVTGEGDFSQNYAASHTFNNAGTFSKSGAATTTIFTSVGFTNTGTVEIPAGTLRCNDGFTQLSGQTTLAGGSFSSTTAIQILGGTLGGVGIVTGNVTNSGFVTPGASPGLLTITGNYTQTTNGALNIELAGVSAGTNYDRLAVSGTASLAGALNVALTNDFYPSPSAIFTFLTAATRTGTFARFNYPSNDVGLLVNYTTTNAAIQVINVRPVLPVFADQITDELVPFTLNAAGTDADSPSQTLTYALTNAPQGTTIDTGTGMISWTPTEAQGPMSTNATVLVTDNGTPNLTVSRTFQITVNELNVAPVLTLPPSQPINEEVVFSAMATATDADLPTNTWAFELLSGPSGLTVAPGGAISWTPTEAQGPGSYPVSVRVTDTNSDAVNEQHLSTTNSFTLAVQEVNRPPILTVPPNQMLLEQTTLSVAASATDPDEPANTLTFSLLSPPEGLNIDTNTGAISWTPTEAQGPSTNLIWVVVTDDSPLAATPHLSATNTFTVTVLESNRPPVLTVPANQTINELTTLSVSASATDPDVPTNALTFALVTPPTGATINSTSGLITWTPAENQGSNTYTLTVTVTDTNATAVNAKSLSATDSFTVTVNEVNVAPVLPAIVPQTVNEGVLLTVTNTATDADIPANPLTYQLLGAPLGAAVDGNGIVTWTPAENQGSNTYTLTMKVTDTNATAVNATSLSATNSFTVIVNEVNSAPSVDAMSNRTVNAGQTISFTATATDPDLPTNTLSFSLESPPAGATISSGGAFYWRPTVAQAGTTNPVLVVVQDNGTPVLRGSNTFRVVVNPLSPVLLKPLGLDAAGFWVEVSGMSGPDYVLMASSNLTDWADIVTNQAPSVPFQFNDDAAGSFTNRSYRVRLSP